MVAIALVEFLFVVLIVLNYRACAKGWFWTTVSTDGVIALMGFTLIRWIGESSGWAECAAYVVAAMLGAAAGMWLTRHWKDQ